MARVNDRAITTGTLRGIARASENNLLPEPLTGDYRLSDLQNASSELSRYAISEIEEELPPGFQMLGAELIATAVSARGLNTRSSAMEALQLKARELLRNLKEFIDGERWNPEFS